MNKVLKDDGTTEKITCIDYNDDKVKIDAYSSVDFKGWGKPGCAEVRSTDKYC